MDGRQGQRQLEAQMNKTVDAYMSIIRRSSGYRIVADADPTTASRLDAVCRQALSRGFINGLGDGTGTKHLDEFLSGLLPGLARINGEVQRAMSHAVRRGLGM